MSGHDDDPPIEDSAAVETALRKFFAANYPPGTMLTHDWLHDALGMPERDLANSFEAYQKWQFIYMSRREAFQKTLLLSHNIALASVYSKGYRIVLPGEQSTWAAAEAANELRRALSKGIARASHVNMHALTQDERRTQHNDLERLKALREVTRRDETQRRAQAKREGMIDPDAQ